jgi:hypothetical protein
VSTISGQAVVSRISGQVTCMIAGGEKISFSQAPRALWSTPVTSSQPHRLHFNCGRNQLVPPVTLPSCRALYFNQEEWKEKKLRRCHFGGGVFAPIL